MKRVGVLVAVALAGCAGPAAEQEPLRVESVSCYRIHGSRRAIIAPNAYAPTRPHYVQEPLLVIRTNRPGVVGYGRGYGKEPSGAAKQLVGRNPLDLFVIKDRRIAGIREDAKDFVYGLRGHDMAILDIVGKVLDRPVADLFGPLWRDSVELYDGTVYLEDLLEGKDLNGYPFKAETPIGRLGKKAQWVVNDRGIRHLKIKIGRPGRMNKDPKGVDQDIAAIREIRRAVGPDVKLFVDGNNGYSDHPEWVLKFARGVRDCDIWAMEEMLPENVEHYGNIRAELKKEGIDMLICEGESLHNHSAEWENDYLKSGLIDIAQPDCNNFGILGIRLWAEMAGRHKKRLICHNFSTKLGVWGSIHVALCTPNSDLVECDDAEFPAIRASGFEFRDGRARLTGKPGLGIEVDPKALVPKEMVWTTGPLQ